MLKKMFKTILVLSLCIGVVLPTNAAVSVSDGSAFVTKAEFAADLNNLSNRMAQLENSLDAKIDSLVSSYLTRNGIWNGAKQDVLNQYYWISPHNNANLTRDYTWTAGNGNYIGPTKSMRLTAKYDFKTPSSYSTGVTYKTYFTQDSTLINNISKSGMLTFIVNVGNPFSWAGYNGTDYNKLMRFDNVGTSSGKQLYVTTGIDLNIKVGTEAKVNIPLAVYIPDDNNHKVCYGAAASVNSYFFFVSKGDQILFDVYWYLLGNSESSKFATDARFEYIADNANYRYDQGFAFYLADCAVY